MRRIACFLLSAVMTVALAACGATESPEREAPESIFPAQGQSVPQSPSAPGDPLPDSSNSAGASSIWKDGTRFAAGTTRAEITAWLEIVLPSFAIA